MSDITDAFLMFFQFSNLFSITGGVFLGMVVGSIPGLTATMAIALLIPLTFTLKPVVAISLLVGAYKGSAFGGSIPAILINTPGTPAAAATVIDGYELAKQGKSMKALKAALYSSVMADGFSDIVLMLIAPPLGLVALKTGPPAMTALILFSLMVITMVAGKSMIKGILAGVLGLMLATIGLDPIMATRRFGFGLAELDEGLSLIPMLIGLFAVSEFFVHSEKKMTANSIKLYVRSKKKDDNRVTKDEMKSMLPIIGLSSLIGTFIGALPGIGTSVAAFIGYGQAKKFSKNSENFGKGAVEGVAAAEAGNNAVAGANLIPLLTLGIPGDIGAAVLLGAFMIQGLHPGPLLFENNIVLIYAIFMSLLFANFINLIIGLQYIKIASKVSDLPRAIIFPTVLAFCFVGAFATQQSMFGIWVALIFGILGYIMKKTEFPAPPLLIAFILEPMLEISFRQSLLLSSGRYSIFLQDKISLTFLILTIIAVIAVIKGLYKKRA